jgi:hypothetical protein
MQTRIGSATLNYLVFLVDWLVAQHDDDEGDGEGEDSVDEDEELSVSEASRLPGRVHIVLDMTALALTIGWLPLEGREKDTREGTSVMEPNLYWK